MKSVILSLAFRACLEKMLRSHVQHLQEALAHMERTAAASSRQGRDWMIQWVANHDSKPSDSFLNQCSMVQVLWLESHYQLVILRYLSTCLIHSFESEFRAKEKQFITLQFNIPINKRVMWFLICPLPNPTGSSSSSSSREALLRQRVENLLETLDKVTRNISERQRHSDDLIEDLKRANRWESCGNSISQALKTLCRWRYVKEESSLKYFQWHLKG